VTASVSSKCSTDKQIHSILKRLHREMHSPERDCRWQYHDKEQIYSCIHLSISARDVVDMYWSQFTA